MIRHTDAGLPEAVTSAAEIGRLVAGITDETLLAVLTIDASAASAQKNRKVAAMYFCGDGDKVDRAGHTHSGKVAQIRGASARDELYADE